METEIIVEKLQKVGLLLKEKTTKECYAISLAESDPEILDDKIGGYPYLPVGEEYPVGASGAPLALLVQVNLENIDLEGYPKKGILEVFVSAAFNETFPTEYAVKIFEPNLEYQTKFPELNLDSFILEGGYKIELSKTTSSMPSADYRFNDMVIPLFNEVFETEIDKYRQIDDYLESIGYDDYWEGEVNEVCDLHSATIGGYADFTQDDVRGDDSTETECLFKLDSTLDYRKFSIGDSGIISVLISPEDIATGNFSKASVDWDCC